MTPADFQTRGAVRHFAKGIGIREGGWLWRLRTDTFGNGKNRITIDSLAQEVAEFGKEKSHATAPFGSTMDGPFSF
ncbi:hypothetical protein, partial [Escherichia coli]|uniref:hypothetical protein n=1 Tax=Escherichia coli TaxID=562 RepID=UPI0022F0D7E3